MYNYLLPLLLLMSTAGCAPYRYPTQCYEEWSDALAEIVSKEGEDPQSVYENQIEALNSPLYDYIPRHRSQIYSGDIGHWFTWALFGNDEDGIYGESPQRRYRYEQPNTQQKATAWYFRNPCHNFCYYVIGDANRPQTQVALISISRKNVSLLSVIPPPAENFPDKNTCFFLGFNGCKPFISLRLRYTHCRTTDIYLGWRNKGNFGGKMVLFGKG